MSIPLIGRLKIWEWPLVIVSLFLAWLEYVSMFVTMLLPQTVISIFTSSLKRVYSLSHDPADNIARDNKNTKYKYLDSKSYEDLDVDKYHLMIDLLNSPNFPSMCKLFGYGAESHIIKTKDNYLLTVHHIVKSGNSSTPRNGKVIYLHHGLLMSSEIWVTMLDNHSNLPFLLYDLGYDVWLGNNRGNKYSQKHIFYPTNSEKFWDFSLDEFALFDIPNTVDFILDITGVSSLTYIGFSQGSSQAFASISINPELTHKIDRMIAISPATTPHGLYSKFLDILLKASPTLMYLIFSRRVLMPSVQTWQSLMYPPFFDTMIDFSNYGLFNWKSLNICKIQKIPSYAHLYSTTSVKCVVHWFQVMASKKFQMFDDSFTGQFNTIDYPLKNIKVPIHIIYGDIDSLVDIDVMKNQLPSHTTTQPVANHEHLDNLWGKDVKEKVFKYVLEYLGQNNLIASNIKTNESYLLTKEPFIEEPDEFKSQPTQAESLTFRRPSSGAAMFL